MLPRKCRTTAFPKPPSSNLHKISSQVFRLTNAHRATYATDQGQGGAQSIEEGAAIGVLLRGLHADSPHLAELIEQRLQTFEVVRRKRASLMQIFSNAGQDEAEKVRDEATKLLREDREEAPMLPNTFAPFDLVRLLTINFSTSRYLFLSKLPKSGGALPHSILVSRKAGEKPV